MFGLFNRKTISTPSEERRLTDPVYNNRSFITSKKHIKVTDADSFQIFSNQAFRIEETNATRDNIHITLREVDDYSRRITEVWNDKSELLSDYLVELGLAIAPTKFEKLGIAARMKGFKKRGIGNNEYAYILTDEDTYFTLPASLGASAHYGMSLEAHLMKQNSYMNLAITLPNKGMAETLMEYNKHLLQGEELSTVERFFASSYDRGLYTGGLGNWLNREIFFPIGWGRVYKDEKGALPSIVGLAGRILDESYLYYANINPDFTLLGQDYRDGLGFAAIESESGLFQTMFEDTTAFALSVSQSLGMYVAISQPMEIFQAEVNKSFIDHNITNTIIDNTPQPRSPGSTINNPLRDFGKLFGAEWYFGDLSSAVIEPGGITAAVIKQRFWLDEHTINGRPQAFYDYNAGALSGFHVQQIIQRQRAHIVMQGTFKPFLMDLVNPFDYTTTHGKQSYDEFNLAVINLIDTIAKPVDLKVGIKKGQTISFNIYEVAEEAAEDLEDNLFLGKFNLNRGTNPKSVVRIKENKTISNFTQLHEIYKKNDRELKSKLDFEAHEISKKMEAAGISAHDIDTFIREGHLTPSMGLTMLDIKEVKERRARIVSYNQARINLDIQLGENADKFTYNTIHTGASHKIAVAAALQDILDMIPLNPFKWGVVSRSIEGKEDVLTISQLFSFRDNAEYVEQLITGETSISRVFKEFEPVLPPNVDKESVGIFRYLSNIVNVRVESADKIAGAIWNRIKTSFKKGDNEYIDIDETTKRMRQAEVKIVESAKPNKGLIFKQTENTLNTIRSKGEIIVEATEETIGLIDEIINYNNELGAKGIDYKDVGRAIDRTAMADITDDITKVTDKFSGNIKAEALLKSSTGYIAAAVFAGLALNNILQSTGGASITAQLGLVIYGEDEDIAVNFEGNRYLPTEWLGQLTGWNQTAINFTADVLFTGAVYGTSYKLAKSIKTRGYMPYTFTDDAIEKLIREQGYEVVDELGKTIDIKKMNIDNPAKVYLKSAKGEMSLIKTASGFKTQKIMQSFAQNVHTKTLIFSSIGILATNALRESGAILLKGMAESPEDKNFLLLGAAMTGTGFLLGAATDNIFVATKPHPLLKSPLGLQLAAQHGIANQNLIVKKTLFESRAFTFAVGGALLAGALYTGKLVFDPNIKETGSLDPIIAGAVAGIGLGIMKKSLAVGAISTLFAASTMAALNWAGITFLQIGRAGQEIDAQNARLVGQLAQFSTAVLEAEKDATIFDLTIAAYATQFGINKNVLSKASVAGETQVIAKQAPLPFLQFFVAERIEGKRGSIGQRIGPDTERTVRTYTVGIQSGTLLGTSMSVELPVAYTPGEGFFGLTYNPNNNLMAIPKLAMSVGVWAGLAVGSAGIVAQAGQLTNLALYKTTGIQMFAQDAESMGRIADDLFDTAKFIYNAAEKITSYYIRTITGTLASLQGADFELAHQIYSTQNTRMQNLANFVDSDNFLHNSSRPFSIDDMSPWQKASVENLNLRQDNWRTVGDSLIEDTKAFKLLKIAGRGRHAFVGALLGATVAGYAASVYKEWRIRASNIAQNDYEIILKVEKEEEKNRTLYITLGAITGGVIQATRNSFFLRDEMSRGGRTAWNAVPNKVSDPLNNLYNKTRNLHQKFVSEAQKKLPKTLFNKRERLKVISKHRRLKFLYKKAYKPLAKGIKYIGKHKTLGIFAAAFLFNYVRTSSEFGIAQYMDRRIVYDNRGNAYDNYEQQTESNIVHHMAVAGSLGLFYTGVITTIARPGADQKQILIEFADRNLTELNQNTPKSMLRKITDKFNIIGRFNRFTTDKEATRILDVLTTVTDIEAQILEEVTGAYGSRQLPEHIQRIRDVIRFRNHLGKEELKEFMKLRQKKLQGLSMDIDEQEVYEKFFRKIQGSLASDDAFKSLSKGLSKSRSFQSFAIRGAAVLATLTVIQTSVSTLLSMGGKPGKDSYLDRIYLKANQVGKIGQRRQDGSFVGLEGFISIAADFLRIITGRDVIDLNYAVDSLNGTFIRTTGQRLVSNAKGIREAQRTIKDLSELLIIDNPNAYIATLDFGGKTLRQGDKGVTTSSYFQLQSHGQDISTATYSMAAKFIFNQYIAGRGRLATIVDRALVNFQVDDPSTFEAASVGLRNATSMLHALKNSRRLSRATAETAATFAGDSLASMILAARQEAVQQISWQPVDSLFTMQFFEAVDKAKHRNQDNSFVKFLQGLAKNEGEALKIFGDLLAGGIFESFYRRTAISNVIFFSGTFGKPPRKGNAQRQVTSIYSLWYQTHDITVQSEAFKQNRINLVDNFIDKVVLPMSNHSLLSWLPDEIKIGGAAIVSLGLSSFMIMRITAFTNTKAFEEQTGELLDVFGRGAESTTEAVVTTTTESSTKIVRDYNRKGNTPDKWEKVTTLDPNKPKARGKHIASMKRTKAGVIENKHIITLEITSQGKPKHVRYALSELVDLIGDDDTFDHFIDIIKTKADSLRDMFMIAQPDGSRKSLMHSLLHLDNVENFLKDTVKGFSLYDVFIGKTDKMSWAEFSEKASKNFIDKFDQVVTKVLDLDNLDGTGLFSTVIIEGEEVLVIELMDEDFDINKVKDQDIATRKQVWVDNKTNFKNQVIAEVENIVKEELQGAKWSGKGANIAPDAEQLSQIYQKALQRVKTQMQDPTSKLGIASKGGGWFGSVESVPDEVAAKNRAAQKGKKKKYKFSRNISGGGTVEGIVDDMIDALHYSTPKQATGLWSHLSGTFKGLSTAAFAVFDIATGADVLGAYMRTAEAMTNPLASDLDRIMAKKELGRALLTTAVGTIYSLVFDKIMKVGQVDFVKKLWNHHGGKILGGVIGSTIVGGALGIASWDNLIKPGMKRLGRYLEENSIMRNIKKGFDNAWFATADTLGIIGALPLEGVGRIGRAIGKEDEAIWFTGAFLGGFLGAGAALFGITAGAISLPVLALTSLGVGLVLGVSAIFYGQEMTDGINFGTREFMKIPFIGGTMTDPYRQIRNQERFKHHFVNSPFLLGYVGDIVNSNWLQSLSAVSDPTGRDTMALFFGNILAEGEGFGVAYSAWRVNAAESMIGAPPPLTDAVIQNELKIRAQLYSDNIIGRYTWDELVNYSDNSDTIRNMEAQKRAERIKIIEQARVRAMKAAVDGGGPQQALRTGNPRKAAITQQTITRLEAVYNDLDTYGKPVTKVTHATIITHKNQTANKDQDNADEVKAQALAQNGVGVASISKDYIYNTDINIDKTMATIQFNKEQHPLNPLLVAQAEVVDGNKAQPPEIVLQTASYNSYKDDD